MASCAAGVVAIAAPVAVELRRREPLLRLRLLRDRLFSVSNTVMVRVDRVPRLGPRKIIAAGLLPTGAGITALVAIGPATSLWWARLVLLVMGLGMSGVFIPAQTAAFATTSNEDMGGASMLFNALRQLGVGVGWLPPRGRPDRFRKTIPVDRMCN